MRITYGKLCNLFMLVHNSNDPIQSIVGTIYGDLLKKYQDDKYFRDRVISLMYIMLYTL